MRERRRPSEAFFGFLVSVKNFAESGGEVVDMGEVLVLAFIAATGGIGVGSVEMYAEPRRESLFLTFKC